MISYVLYVYKLMEIGNNNVFCGCKNSIKSGTGNRVYGTLKKDNGSGTKLISKGEAEDQFKGCYQCNRVTGVSSATFSHIQVLTLILSSSLILLF